ncbi:MAG: glycoside hydrolase family 99-like domain-containing protein [Micromonosporaceae bacterium]
MTAQQRGPDDRLQVAAIYFPSWHADPRQEERYGPGWSEWDLIKAGRPRFEGHYQPIVPQWGYADETDPAVMSRSVEQAAAHGIDAFLWDWYWYEERDFLNRPLDEAYLRLEDPPTKFALMWANHHWTDVFPARVGRTAETVWSATLDAAHFRRMTDVIIERYLTSPNYWRVDGAAWFTIFQLDILQDGLGGVSGTADALADFRARCRAAGVGELHLNAMCGRWSGDNATPPLELGIDSVGPYTWAHIAPLVPLAQGLVVDYAGWREQAQAKWRVQDAQIPVTYVPNVTMGWDSTTRVHADDELVVSRWPMLPVVVGNCPAEFETAVAAAREFVASRGGLHVITVNAWNEWTEGSYLEPDDRYGLAYLEALARGLTRR